jgi:hypothetical protein
MAHVRLALAATSLTTLIVLAPPAEAGRPTLSADRPGFANSPESVALGHVVLEGGLGFAGRLEGSADPRVNLPAALARIGLPVGLEARLTVPSLVVRPEGPPGANDVGATDFGLGMKLALDTFLAADFSAIASMTLPIEAGGFGADDDVTGNLNVNFVWSPAQIIDLTLAANVGWARRAAQVSGAFALGLDLDAASPYVQVIGDRSAASERVALPDGRAAELTQELYSVGLGAGVAWMPSRTLQLDAFVDLFPFSDATSLGDAIPRGLTSLFSAPVRLEAGVGVALLL